MERLERRHPRAIDLGLERCGRVYERLGRPRPGDRCVVVAGTNGKGSTVAWLEALLEGAGCRTVAYTSPHVLDFRERLRVAREMLDEAQWVAAFEAVERARGEVSLTYFEFTTLAAFWLAERHAPDIALLEVGLGGRLDTVNLVDGDVIVITPIGLDHQQWLGPDRETIGAEKAGVLRPKRPVVLAEEQPPDSILGAARDLACEVYQAGRDFRLEQAHDGLCFEFASKPEKTRWKIPATVLPLPGSHQRQNLAAALAAAALLEPDRLRDAGLVVRSLRETRLAGRLQPHAADPRLLLDVGHNPMAAEAIAAFLRESAEPPVQAVFAMLGDKDVEATARALAPMVSVWHCAGLEGPRGEEAELMAGRVATALEDAAPVRTHPSVAQALTAALAQAAPDQRVLVFGSFLTVAAALEHLSRART